MSVRKRPAAKRKAPLVKPKPEPKVHLASSGRAAAVQAGTTDHEVAGALTGLDQVPDKGMELGRPPDRPPFDPHAREREERASIMDGMENDADDDINADGIPLVSAMIFVGVEHTEGDFERRLREVMAYAEGKGLINMTATVGSIGFGVINAIEDSNNG